MQQIKNRFTTVGAKNFSPKYTNVCIVFVRKNIYFFGRKIIYCFRAKNYILFSGEKLYIVFGRKIFRPDDRQQQKIEQSWNKTNIITDIQSA